MTTEEESVEVNPTARLIAENVADYVRRAVEGMIASGVEDLADEWERPLTPSEVATAAMDVFGKLERWRVAGFIRDPLEDAVHAIWRANAEPDR